MCYQRLSICWALAVQGKPVGYEMRVFYWMWSKYGPVFIKTRGLSIGYYLHQFRLTEIRASSKADRPQFNAFNMRYMPIV